MYQNRLGPSGGIYYPNFVPCFVVVQLNGGYGQVGCGVSILQIKKWLDFAIEIIVLEVFIGYISNCHMVKPTKIRYRYVTSENKFLENSK